MRTARSILVFLVGGLVALASQSARGGGVVMECTEASLRAAISGGGAVTFGCNGTITLTNSISITNDITLDASGHQITISGNNLVRVFLVRTNTQFSINHLTIANGRSTNGAALFNAGGTVNVTDSIFYGNCVVGGSPHPNAEGESVSGGAVANQGVFQAVNCSFTNNVATGGAGGAPYGGPVGNAGGSGAGAAIRNSGLILISGCTFAGNTATGGIGGDGPSGAPMPWPTQGYPGGAGGAGAGGALFNSGTARLVNCTLAFNTGIGGAGGFGGPGYRPSPDYPPGSPGANGSPGASIGGIDDASGLCYLTNCTVAFNSGAGISTTATNGSKLINTLLSANLPGGNGSGMMTDFGHNLSSDMTCAFTNAGSMNNVYPLLGPLNSNGGPTLTLALLPGCAAIDAADTPAAPSTDQRGIARPFGIVADIGAYEYNGATNPGPSKIVTECTEAELRAAMSGGGQITFACDGTIVLASTVAVVTNTFLDAANHQIILQGKGIRLFEVGTNVTLAVANLAISGGNAAAGAGIHNAGGFVNATNCVFSANIATHGGAIQNEAGEVFLSACIFTNNHALGVTSTSGGTGWGGALENAGTLTADLCTFTANSATGIDGLSATWYGYPGGSGATAAGGAIHNSQTITISRSTFTNNFVVAGKGGSGFVGAHGDPGWSGGNGVGGGAGGYADGGALYNAGIARIIDSTFAFNSGTGGNGGVGGDGGPAYGSGWGGLGGGGGAGGRGVGAVFDSGNIQIINSTFAFNLGSPGSGGKGGDGGSGNFGGAGGSGAAGGPGSGALYSESQSSPCRITNCTFAANSVTNGYGGNPGSGGNPGGNPGTPGSVGFGSGGLSTSGSKLINTILTANLPGGNFAGAMIDLGHNLSSDATCAFTSVGSLNNIDPKLGPLTNNGGPTLTMALLRGSPAIDAGDDLTALAEDQRGLPRPIGSAVDIGAFEYGSPALLTLTPCVTGGVDLFVIGKRGQPCRLLASETLLNWDLIYTNQFNGSGVVIYHETTGCPCKFYRVLLP